MRVNTCTLDIPIELTVPANRTARRVLKSASCKRAIHLSLRNDVLKAAKQFGNNIS